MRIVVKVGTSTLTYENGKLDLRTIQNLVRVLSDLKNRGHEVILVSSGAITVGASKLKLAERPSSSEKKQAAAAVGQSELMSIYDEMFSGYGYTVGQILLTKDDVDIPKRKAHIINTFSELLNYNCVPIINENDSVEVEEIKFGDNDTLSAIVAVCTNSDILIMLSDIYSLYDSDPHKNPNAKPIKVVDKIDDKIKALGGGVSSKVGTGGMYTKIKAAQIATSNGIDTYIAFGKTPDIIYDILEGKKDVGTLFRGHKSNQ